nr:chitooligosaccharide deacetylase NodB [Actinoplanes digitatis]
MPNGTGPAKSLRTTGTATVALTFDDGPDPVQTPKILELLAKYQVKATFCLVGEQARKYPDLVRQIAAAGHTLCNHTWNHSLKIGKDKRGKIRADLRRTNDAIRAAVPSAAIPFFRAPGGNFTDALVETAYEDGMTSLYWEVDPRDWEHLEKDDDAAHIDKIVKSVQNEVRPGSIVLSHDFNQPDTIRAYDELLPWLNERFELGVPSEPKPPAEQPPAEQPSAQAPAAEAPAAEPAGQPAADA